MYLSVGGEGGKDEVRRETGEKTSVNSACAWAGRTKMLQQRRRLQDGSGYQRSSSFRDWEEWTRLILDATIGEKRVVHPLVKLDHGTTAVADWLYSGKV
jgi:hypothetical protein